MLVSVVIPTYNRDKYILKSVQSVLNQQIPDGYTLEVIVVDDGSTDNTKTALKSVAKHIKYIKTSNSGRPAVARNIGIKVAKGELIAFQDSDDIWMAGKLTAQLPIFKNSSITLVYGNAEFMSASGKRRDMQIISSDEAANGMVFDHLIKQNFISTLTAVVRKEALVEFGGFNESWSVRGVEDYELWLRLSLFGNFHFVDKTLALYRQHDGNISSKSEVVSYLRLVNVFRETIRICQTTQQKKLAYNSLLNSLSMVYTLDPIARHKIRTIYYRFRKKLI